MFIPLFIALLLGLVNPANVNNTSNCHGGGTVVINAAGDPDPSDPGDPNDPGDGTGGDDGTGGGPGGPTGDNGQLPPPKP